MKEHKIVYDSAGWGNHPRLTCLPCRDTLVRQPYMTSEQFKELARKFEEKHKPLNVEKSLLGRHVHLAKAEETPVDPDEDDYTNKGDGASIKLG